jgi:hypothetical protein
MCLGQALKIIVWSVFLLKSSEPQETTELGYKTEQYGESPGLYYEHLGETSLYNTEWKAIIYVNLGQTDQEVDQLGQYIEHVIQLCQLTEVQNWTDCNHFSVLARENFVKVKGSEGLLRELIGGSQEPGRKRRGVLNFVGEISKILFGTLDSDDAEYYNEQIRHFEENSEDITSLMKQQLSIVKATLGTFNETVSDLEYNSNVIKSGLIKLKDYMESVASNSESRLNILDVKITVEGYIAKVNNALDAMQRNLDLMIESVMNAQKGILQPQIISPSLIVETLRSSISSFPKDTMAPFILSKDSLHLVTKICDIHIYVRNNIMGFVINVPLISRGTFKTFRLIPIPIAIEKNKFIYLETENKLLYVDQIRQYYFSTGREELRRCKALEPNKYICKQNKPLLNSHMQECCEIKMLQPRLSIPKLCDTRIVQITHPIWTQLEKGNEWIYFIPLSDSMTILCPEKDPMDIVLTGTGKLMIRAGCRGYSSTALLETRREIQANTSKLGGDLLSKIETPFECCENLGIPRNLSKIELDTKFKHIVSHIDDLKYASFKISELEKKVKEQEWKQKHDTYHKTYSTIAYIFVSILILYGMYKLGRIILNRWRGNRTVRAIVETTSDVSSALKTSGSGNIVNINIKTSNESLSGNPEAIPLHDLEGSSVRENTPELRRSRRSKATKSYF